ncbi:hypothetical protein EZS27_029261 [termite gut metagenome]|uniref:Uncharacterized protein n=1 Tax=termite gut metagenome TaxID=433724 RepID=A0A5J4QHP4_9ZZZZ
MENLFRGNVFIRMPCIKHHTDKANCLDSQEEYIPT